MPSAALIIGGALSGGIGWSGHPTAFAAGLALPLLWSSAPTRVVAAGVAAAHFLAASRGLPQGAATFFGSNLIAGLALWLTASLSFILVHAFLWTPRPQLRPFRYAVIGLALALPPFGIVGWAHPITASGVLFPGAGWFGLGLTAALILLMASRLWPLAATATAIAASIAFVSWTPPQSPHGWLGIDTAFSSPGSAHQAQYAQQLATIRLVGDAARAGARVVVLPESALGLWTPTTERLWLSRLPEGVVVLAGADVVTTSGYDNIMVSISKAGGIIKYRERMPVPVAMWQPWTNGGASATFFADPTFILDDATVAPLICYEQLLIWPVLQSMWHKADMIVATGNVWWAAHTNIPGIQRASAQAWASLFQVPLVLSFNH